MSARRDAPTNTATETAPTDDSGGICGYDYDILARAAEEAVYGYAGEFDAAMACHVVLALLHEGGVRGAYGCVARVTLLNQGFIQRADREGRMPKKRQELARWTREDNAYVINLGYGSPSQRPGREYGHCVVLVPPQSADDTEIYALIDPSLAQATRLEQGILVQGFAQPVPPIVAQGEHEFRVRMGASMGALCVACYTLFPEDDALVTSGHWKHCARLGYGLLGKTRELYSEFASSEEYQDPPLDDDRDDDGAGGDEGGNPNADADEISFSRAARNAV